MEDEPEEPEDNMSIYTYQFFQLSNVSGQKLQPLFISLSIIITMYVSKLLHLIHVTIGEHLLLTALSFPLAVIVLCMSDQRWFIFGATPRDVIAILLPLRIFVLVFQADFHILHQCLPSLLLLNTVGLFVFVFIFGFAMSCIVLQEVRFDYIICFGMAMASSDNRLFSRFSRTIDLPRSTLALLLSECVATFANSMIIIGIYMGYADGTVTTSYHIVFIWLRMFLLGLLVGCLAGKLTTVLINPYIRNHENLIMTWIIGGYTLYILCQGYLFISGTFAVMAFAVFMSTEKNRVSIAAFQKMEFIIDSWHFIVTAYAYQLTYGYSAIFVIQIFNMKILFLSLIGIIFHLFARTIVVLCMYPVLFRKSKNNANAIMLMIFARKGVLEICKVRILFHHSTLHVMMEESHAIAMLMIAFEVIMANTIVEPFFNTFGTSFVSHVRKINIANCLHLLEATRVTYVHLFQMDQRYGDANWSLIQEATNLLDSQNWVDGIQATQTYGFRPSCVECQAYAGILMTPYEIAEKLKEIRIIMLRTQRVSFIRQRERGLILKSDLKALFSALDVTGQSNSLHIEISELSVLYKRSPLQNLKKLLVTIDEEIKLSSQTKATTKQRRILVKIIQHPAYEIIIYMFTILDTVIFYYTTFSDCLTQLLYLLPYSVFVLDAILRIHLHFNLINPGGYYGNIWNIFDACMLTCNTLELMLYVFGVFCARYNIYGYVVYVGIMFIGSLRHLTIIKLCYRLRKWIIRYCDYKTDDRVMTGYNRALAILFSYHEVLHIIPTLVEQIELRNAITKEVVKEKTIILAQLNNVQYKFTTVAVVSKTKRIINTSISTMRETIVALKLIGFADETEKLELIDRVDQVRKSISKISYAEINSPSQILKWLPFFESMLGFESLFNAADEITFEPNELILTKGKESYGIYIVIEGMAAMKLTMDQTVKSRLKAYGALPVKDYICDVDYYHVNNHYLISGNSIGILSFLTKRPCDYDVWAVVKTRVFFLDALALNTAMNRNNDPVHGLQSRLWKYVSVNLALGIMWRVPIYRNLRVEETYFYMEKSFVPNLSDKKSIFISDDVEDLILIEGRIRDKISKKVYVAPCYVPRSVRKLQFIRNAKFLIEPQLFIIPLKPELHTRIYEHLDVLKRIPKFAPKPVGSRHSGFKHMNFSERLSMMKDNAFNDNKSNDKAANLY